MTAADYNKEKRIKDNFERLSAFVISYTPWGQWYGAMKAASDLTRDALPKQIGVNKKDGRPAVIYKKEGKNGVITRTIGAIVKPQHEYVGDQLAQGNIFKAFGALSLGTLMGLKEQFSLKDFEIFDISPNELESFLASRENQELPVNGGTIKDFSNINNDINKYKKLQYKSYTPKQNNNITYIVVSLILLFFIFK